MTTAVPHPEGAPAAALSPVQRLQASRARLRNALQAARGQGQAPADGEDADGSLFGGLGRSGRRVWARHPLRGAVRFARQTVGPTLLAELKPLVREHPWTSMAVAAGLGAALVWCRPWRLLPRAALGSALLSFALPRRAIWQELMASGLLERLASGELLARWFQADGRQEARNATAAPPESPTAASAGVLHPAEPPADAARAA